MKHLIILLSIILLPFTAFAQEIDYCEGNFDCDQDVDGTDAAAFKADFGRDQYNNPCPGCPPPAKVSKTGQTTAYATGDDGDLEKGVTWPNPRFTDNLDGTVSDNLTGHIWLKNANCFGQRTWNNALSDCNGLASGMCGLTDGSNAGDWRLPNIKELFSLVDNNYYGPAVPDTVGTGQCSEGNPFNNLNGGDLTWSSNTFPLATNQALYVDMFAGMVYSRIKTDAYFLWPVRGPEQKGARHKNL